MGRGSSKEDEQEQRAICWIWGTGCGDGQKPGARRPPCNFAGTENELGSACRKYFGCTLQQRVFLRTQDSKVVTGGDVGSNFFVTAEDAGSNRAAASAVS